MSEAGGSGGPEGGPPPAPRPIPSAAPSSRRARVGAIINGIFLILFGLCLLLAGGGCTIMLIVDLKVRLTSVDGAAWILIALAVAGVGLLSIIVGIRLCGGTNKRR
jgi:hypothetical protein